MKPFIRKLHFTEIQRIRHFIPTFQIVNESSEQIPDVYKKPYYVNYI